MRKSFVVIAAAAAVLCSCAKPAKENANTAAKQYLEAWMLVNHPEAKTTPLGAYVLENKEGTGARIGDPEAAPFVRVHYITEDLTGTITATSYEKIAQRIGTFTEDGFYGPAVWNRTDEKTRITAGLEEMISDMRVGGVKKVVLPGWLMGRERFKDAEEYLKNGSGSTIVYTVEAVEAIADMKQWEIDSIGRYVARTAPGVTVKDSLAFGFYYVKLQEPTSTKEFKQDTTVYINYIGRLLNGRVFDTTIADTAKFYGIYSASKTYEPMGIKLAEKHTDYSLKDSDGSGFINGFTYTLSKMHYGEKGRGIFYSTLGYGVNGSGGSIPGYSPLEFEIEVVK